MMVGSAGAVVSEDTRLVGMAANALITSPLLPPMSTTPTMCEPGNSVSVSAAAESLIAVPPVPMTLPELVMTAPRLPAPFALMPVTPEIDPELFTVRALFALIAVLVAPVDWMMPVLTRLPVCVSIATPFVPVATIVPELLPILSASELIALCAAEMVPELAPRFTVSAAMAILPAEMMPEFVTLAVLLMLSAIPVAPFALMTPGPTLFTVVVAAVIAMPPAPVASITPELLVTVTLLFETIALIVPEISPVFATVAALFTEIARPLVPAARIMPGAELARVTVSAEIAKPLAAVASIVPVLALTVRAPAATPKLPPEMVPLLDVMLTAPVLPAIALPAAIIEPELSTTLMVPLLATAWPVAPVAR